MASPFDALDAAMGASILKALGGEAALITPRRGGNYSAATPDPARPPITLRGLFSQVPGVNDKIAGRAMNSDIVGGTALETSPAEFWLPKAEAAKLAFALRKGDHLKLTDPLRTDGSFVIVSAKATDLGDLYIILAREAQT